MNNRADLLELHRGISVGSCGCRYVAADHRIAYCPRHLAAPQLLGVLEKIVQLADREPLGSFKHILEHKVSRIHNVIAMARAKTK